MFDPPGGLGTPFSSNLADGPGCLWHVIVICFVLLGVMGFLKWMS
ncbi:MAG: hypothetical protein AAGA92_11825 [Planctomycetota bacterium]